MALTEVSLKGKIVDTIEIPTYASLQEFVDNQSEEKALSCANRQLKADLSNACRAKHRPSTVGKKKKMQMAYQLCEQNVNEENYNKMISLIGKYDEMQAFLESLFPQVEAAMVNEAPSVA